jgi:hypothetical protein
MATLAGSAGALPFPLGNALWQYLAISKERIVNTTDAHRTLKQTASVIMLLLIAASKSPAADNVSAIQKQLAQRRQEYLGWIVDNFSQLEPTMKPLDGRAWSLNQARLFLNKDIAKANQYYESIRLTNDPDFMGIRLLKTLLDFGDSGRLSNNAKDHLTAIIKNWPMDRKQFISRVATWPPAFTENHDLMHLTIGLFSEKLRGQAIEHHLSELRKSLRWRYERGFYEWGSHRYQMHYTNPLQILAEYAPAPDVRRGAEELFNIILAERALMSVGGYLGGPGMRSYDRRKGCDYLDNNRYDSFLPTVWLALGVSEPRFDFSASGGLEPAGDGYGNGRDPRLNQDEAMFLATNRLVPHPIVYELLDEVSTRPELIYVGRRAAAGHPFQNAVPNNPRSHQVVYYYITPHVSMGSLQYLPYAGKMSVSWSPPRFFSVMFAENPSQVLRTRLSDEDLSADEQSYDYVADRIVQHENWLLAAGELSASHGLTSRKTGRWDLFHVGQGLCAHVELPDDWHVFQVSDLEKYHDAQSFVAALTIPTIEDGVAQGVTTNGDRVSVDLKTMSITINDVLREPKLEMLHDSPLMNSVYGSGKITIRTKASDVTFDGTSLRPDDVDLLKLPPGLTRWGNPTSEGSTTTIVHARAMGGLSPQEHVTLLKSVSILIPHNNGGTARVAVYAGGTLERGPHSGVPAQLLYDFGRTAKGDSGWLTLKHPGDGVGIPANTPIWLAWKGSGGAANILYQEYRELRTDFQAARGRWDSKAIHNDAEEPWPETWPADDDGGFDDAWYACYLTLEQLP